MKRLVIFDLDGTLLNTISDLGSANNNALRVSGYPEHRLTSYPIFVDYGVTTLLDLAITVDISKTEHIEAMRSNISMYLDKHLTYSSEPYPGIRQLLHTLVDMDVKVAVASNKYQQAVEMLIARFFPDIPWSAVEGQKEGVPVKPDPSIVFEILGKVPTRKSKVLYVGDSGVDMETARRACVDSCGVTWGFRPVKELRETYADNIVNTPDEIITIVRRPGLELDV